MTFFRANRPKTGCLREPRRPLPTRTHHVTRRHTTRAPPAPPTSGRGFASLIQSPPPPLIVLPLRLAASVGGWFARLAGSASFRRRAAEEEDEQGAGGPRGGRSRRCAAAVPAGAEPALQRPGRFREPAAGARAGQGGRGEGAGAAGTAGPHPREGVRQAEGLLRRPELRELSGSMTTPEMAREVEELRKDCAGYADKLERIKSATNHVTPEEKEKVCSEQRLYCKEWRKRKRMATELLDAILEGYPKSKKQFFEEVGIETDEDHNVTLPAAV
uniref:PSMC3 interacting protein n=1 Tax=Anser cygnoides TaxID=8845 RepID=A0A8B9E8J2_ANSCY|nr:homologous-pairing protein 2 homolog isoform X1 [Anser cygnoides]